MRHSLSVLSLMVVLLGGALAAAPARETRDAADEAAIRQTVGYYFDGGRTGDTAVLARAFAPGARMHSARDGVLREVTVAEWLPRIAAAPRPAGPAEDRTERRVLAVDVVGTAATAKLEQRRPDGSVVTDYMSLLKVGGEWRIVGKIFHVEPAAGAAAR